VNGQKIGGRKTGETPEQGAKRRHPEIDLKDGDQLRVGHTVLQVKTETSPSAGPAVSEQAREEMARLIFDLNAADSPAARRMVEQQVGGYVIDAGPRRLRCRLSRPARDRPAARRRQSDATPRRRGPDQRR